MVTIGRRAQAKAEKRARILAAADNLFHAQGYASTTTQQVAELADVANGTVFTYAATKPELLMMVMNQRLRAAVDQGLAAAETVASPHAAVLALLDPLLQQARAERELFELFIRELLFGAVGEHRAEAVDAVNRLIAAIGEVVCRAGCRPGLEAEQIGRAVLSSVLFELNRIRVGVSEPSLVQVEAQIDLVLHGALAEGASHE